MTFLKVFNILKVPNLIDYVSISVRIFLGLVGWFLVKRPFETVFQSISGRLQERGRKRRERIERKMSKQPPPAPTASAIGPCPTSIQIVGRPGHRHWKFTQDHHTTRPPPISWDGKGLGGGGAFIVLWKTFPVLCVSFRFEI